MSSIQKAYNQGNFGAIPNLWQDALKAEKHIPDYEKKKKFLQNIKWVEDLCAENKCLVAMRRAAGFGTQGESYSNIYKAFELFEKFK